MAKEIFSVANITNNDGCFDLQFRKDTRHERTNSPTYYRWKAQFVITTLAGNVKIMEKIGKELNCGAVSISRDQARFSVQKIDDIVEVVIPYFRKNALAGNKKQDFNLWAKAVEIIYQNKGKQLVDWRKSDLAQLIEIQKTSAKYKTKSRQPKWLDMAQALAKTA